MDQPRSVRGAEGLDHLMDQLRRPDRLERPVLDQGLLEADPAVDVLHLDEMVVAVGPQVMDGDDARVDQIGDDAGLGPELLADLGLAGQEAGVEHLDGAGAAKELVLGLVNPSHRPPADHRAHPVLAEELPRQVVDRREPVVELGRGIGVNLVGQGRVDHVIDRHACAVDRPKFF